MENKYIIILLLFIASISTSGFLVKTDTQHQYEEIIIPESRTNIVIRMDDISDCAKDAQIEIIKIHDIYDMPLSIGIIPAKLGDQELIESIKKRSRNIELCLHGWEHENFTSIDYEGQLERIGLGKARIRELFGAEVTVFIPPFYEYNQDTVQALKHENIPVISTNVWGKLESDHELRDYPVTVQYSEYRDGKWIKKDIITLNAEIRDSVKRFGYAVIGTHPQEFLEGGSVDPGLIEQYAEFLSILNLSFEIGVFKDLYGE